jgi:hypothetical protein
MAQQKKKAPSAKILAKNSCGATTSDKVRSSEQNTKGRPIKRGVKNDGMDRRPRSVMLAKHGR